MAKPPSDDKPDDAPRDVGIGHNNPPEPTEPGPNPTPLAAPLVRKSESPEPDTNQQLGQSARKRPHEESDEEIRRIPGQIVTHSWQKHKENQNEFPGVFGPTDLVNHIIDVIKQHTEWQPLPNNRTAYWHQASGTVVIHDPFAADGGEGTVLQPKEGKKYFDDLSRPKRRR